MPSGSSETKNPVGRPRKTGGTPEEQRQRELCRRRARRGKLRAAGLPVTGDDAPAVMGRPRKAGGTPQEQYRRAAQRLSDHLYHERKANRRSGAEIPVKPNGKPAILRFPAAAVAGPAPRAPRRRCRPVKEPE
jgi:hypothetical protein